MLGNLMDNACKWAENRVIVHCRGEAGRCGRAPLKELDEEALVSILTEPRNALVKQYKRLMRMVGPFVKTSPSRSSRPTRARSSEM